MSAWKAATLLVVLHALFGAAFGMFMDNPVADLVLQVIQIVLMAGVIFAWASLDARAEGKSLGTAQGVCLVLFGYFAVPFYLASYRQTASWLRWTGKGLTIFVGCIGAFMLAAAASSGMLA